MEGQRQRAPGKRRQRRKSKKSRNKTPIEPEFIAARRPDSPFLSPAERAAAAAAQDEPPASEVKATEAKEPAPAVSNGGAVRRRTARIVRASDDGDTQDNRVVRLLDRLERSQGRAVITRAANDLFELDIVPPKTQEIQIQLLEHEDESRAQDAVFMIAELLQKESPIQRPVLDQRLRRLEQSAENLITRDAAGALRRAMRVNHGS